MILSSSFQRLAVSQCVASRLLTFQTRHISHNYQERPHVEQSAGVDHATRIKEDQQNWLNNEQWQGYSDAYLKKFMVYTHGYETSGATVDQRDPQTLHVLKVCHEVYGAAADCLQKLQTDPLHSQFQRVMSDAAVHREQLAAEIDKIYANSHPTIKTLYDAMLVRRYFFLGDWMEALQQQRSEIIQRLSPQFLEAALKGKQLAEERRAHLLALSAAFTNEEELVPVGLDTSRYSANELAIIRRNMRYYRNVKRFGASVSAGDINTP